MLNWRKNDCEIKNNKGGCIGPKVILGGKLTKRKSCLLKPKFISSLGKASIAGEAFLDQQKKIMKGGS